jgi:protein-S-isoprenylcysteine O-methyltransferase Ste14
MNPVFKRVLQIAFLFALQGVCLFAGAGQLTWLAGWAYMGLYVGIIALNAALMLPGGTELIAERSKYLENTRGWDRVVMLLGTLLSPGMLLVAGLDQRWSWSPPVALPLRIVCFVLMAAGFGFFSWAMYTNRFFSTRVRIQDDRGHSVTTGGPYRFVRHPGYIGTIVYTLATPFMLGSLWAIIPGVLLAAVVVVRTALEDRTLQNELAGYAEYAQKTRYRLVPGLW